VVKLAVQVAVFTVDKRQQVLTRDATGGALESARIPSSFRFSRCCLQPCRLPPRGRIISDTAMALFAYLDIWNGNYITFSWLPRADDMRSTFTLSR